MFLASRVTLRWSLALLFVWFGTQQLLHPAQWVSYLPEWTGYLPMPSEMFVQLNGWLEICLATLLAIGVYTRFSAGLLGLHLAGIAVTAGGAVGVRDATLAAACISVVLGGADQWSLDASFAKETSAKQA